MPLFSGFLIFKLALWVIRLDLKMPNLYKRQSTKTCCPLVVTHVNIVSIWQNTKKRESNNKLNHKTFHWLTIHSFNCRQQVLLKKYYVIVTEWGIWGMTDYFLAHTEGMPLVWEEHNPPCQTPGWVNNGFAYCAWLCFTVYELSTLGSLCCIVISSPTCWMFYYHLKFPSKRVTLFLSKIK